MMPKLKPTIEQLLEKYNLELLKANADVRIIRNQHTDTVRTIVAQCDIRDGEGESRSVLLLDDGRVLRSLAVWDLCG
jgi:hypothetical protein